MNGMADQQNSKRLQLMSADRLYSAVNKHMIGALKGELTKLHNNALHCTTSKYGSLVSASAQITGRALQF